jgi:1,4-dihydroxy-2-naphthoate octaprenyltransferase
VDAWTYRKADGTVVFHPLGEINARMTFGLVAWAGASRSQPSTRRMVRG